MISMRVAALDSKHQPVLPASPDGDWQKPAQDINPLTLTVASACDAHA